MLLPDLTPDTVQALLSVAGPPANSPLLMVELRQLGGALGNPPTVPDAVGPRTAGYCLLLLGVLMPPIADLVPHALTTTVERLAPFTTGHTFVNMHGTPSSVKDRARPWTKDTYDRLLQMKQ